MQLVVGRIARAHGVHGEVSVEVRTDAVDERFTDGSVLETVDRTGQPGPRLIVRGSRPHAGRLLVLFAEVTGRDLADALRGHLLVVDSATSAPVAEADEWWDHELIGLPVVTTSDEPVGELADVLHTAGADLLAIRGLTGGELLVPFIAAFVPEVDVAGRRIVIDPPPGLLDLAEE